MEDAVENIGLPYRFAIGYSYVAPGENLVMPKKPKRSFLERALEALADRYPKEKPTQVRLAKIVGVAQPTANEWGELGRYPTMEGIARLAEETGYCIEWLVMERGPKKPPPNPASDDELSPILQAWPDLSPNLRRQLAKYADFIKDNQ